MCGLRGGRTSHVITATGTGKAVAKAMEQCCAILHVGGVGCSVPHLMGSASSPCFLSASVVEVDGGASFLGSCDATGGGNMPNPQLRYAAVTGSETAACCFGKVR